MTSIYLSSTYEDLKLHRGAVFDALRKSGYRVVAMEDYVAADERPVDQCLKDVAAADLYVGIFAFRYGYVPPQEHDNPDGLSITELEFRHAAGRGIPCLTFVVKDGTAWPLNHVDAYTEPGGEQPGARIKRLREDLLTQKSASLFSSPHELAALVQPTRAGRPGRQSAVTRQLEKTRPRAGEEVIPPAPLTWDIAELGSPFPGLMHFTRRHAPVFFGRESEVREILDRLQTPQGHFLIVSGNSGTGKSSLIDAGVLPRLEATGLADQKDCLCKRMTPSQGSHPFDALVRAFDDQVQQAGLNPFVLGEELQKEPESFSERIRQIVAGIVPETDMVLFLDQMEELFTGIQGREWAARNNAFLSALYQATEEGHLRVIATLRSDFLHFCHDHPEMREVLKSGGHYPLGKVESFMLRDMILKPAECAGLSVSDALVRRLIQDTGSDPGNLPLLAFVLQRLFDDRQEMTLAETAYEAFDGVEGAIRDHVRSVEIVIEKELGAKALQQLPTIFRSLLVVNADGQPTRRRAVKKDFREELNPIIDRLIEERLLAAEGEGETSTVSVAHEKLFETWPALSGWIAANRDELMLRDLLQALATSWQSKARPRFEGLASRSQRKSFRKIRDASDTEKAFLKASRKAAAIGWISVTSVGVLMLLAVTFFWWINAGGIRSPKQGWEVLLARAGLYSLRLEMVKLPLDEYRRGDIQGDGDRDELPVSKVTIVRPIAVSRYEVTFDEYDLFAGVTGRQLPHDQGWGAGRRPVINVSWEDAVAYADWLSGQTGKRYRLPTEAEWEYAARAGSETAYWWGDEVGDGRANCDGCGSEWDDEKTAPVGSFQANRFGLYDYVNDHRKT